MDIEVKKGKWETLDGRILKIRDMSSIHLYNCIKMMAGNIFLNLYTVDDQNYCEKKMEEIKKELKKREKELKKNNEAFIINRSVDWNDLHP